MSLVEGIPLPVVRLNRWMLVLGILAGFLLGQPLVTTGLLVIVGLAVIGGPAWSVPYQLVTRLAGPRLRHTEREDRALMRFNNSIAVAMLAAAQLAFLAGYPVVGWGFALVVALAAAVALAGFCIGCVLYFQVKQLQARLRSLSV